MGWGCTLSFFPAVPRDEYLAIAREVEARGYETAWVGEAAGGDAVTTLALLAGATRRLGLATGVVAVQTRTPVLLGLTAATLAHAAPGRVTLGLGLSSRTVVADWHGQRYATALGQVREAVEIVRRVAAGERVTFEGRYFRVRNFRMAAPPPSEPPRIVLAALGPRMLELAGEIADGVLLNWCAPESVPGLLAHLERGARRAGRSLDGFEVAAFVRTCVTDDPAAARHALAREITGYAIVDVYGAYFRACGYAPEVDALNRAWAAGDRAGAVAQVTPRLLDALGVVGDAAACRERLAAFRRAGLTQPVVVPLVPGEADRRGAILRTLRAFP